VDTLYLKCLIFCVCVERMNGWKTNFAFPTAFRMKKRVTDKQGFWVRGSGLVYIPKDRANEIQKVIEEHHRFEAQQNLILLSRPRY